MKYLIKPIIKHHYLTTFLIFIITLFLGYNLKNLRFDSDITAMLPDDHPTKMAQQSLEEDFGAAEMIMIGLKTDDIFNVDFLKKIKDLSKKIKKLKIESDPFVDPETNEKRTKKKRCIANVTSLSTMNYINGTPDGMEVSALMKKVPKNSEEMELLKKKVFSWDLYLTSLVSPDSKATLIGVEYKNTLTADELVRMAEAVRETVGKIQFGKDVKVYIAGEPFVRAMVVKNMAQDLTFMIPVVFGIVILFLFFTMRKISSVVLILLTIATSVVWTMGLMAIFNVDINLITSAIPILLVAIGSAYSIHIVSHYSAERINGKNVIEAVEHSISVIGISVLGAALTTMAGFMSLMTSSIVPMKQFGLFTGVGTVVAFVVSVIFVPALILSFSKMFEGSPKKVSKGIDLVPFFLWISRRMTRDYKLVFVLSILVYVTSFAFTLHLRPDLDIIRVFKKQSEIRQANDFLCDKFGGTTTMVLALDSGEDDYFKNPDILRKLDDLRVHMKQDPIVGMVLSLAVPLKRMNYAMHSNKKEYDAIPETKQQVSQYLLLNSDPEALEGMVTSDYSKARVVILLKDGSSLTVKRITNNLNKWLNQEMPGMKVLSAGTSQLALAMNEMIVSGQIRSLIFSVITVLIISSFILRSFMGGLLAITPLSISVIMNFGLMGLFRIPLDAGTAMISAMAIGIAVDYSIHLLNGIRFGLITQGSYQAVTKGIEMTGNAITFNALSVALGFLVLTFSSFTNLINMGFFIAFTMVTACAGTLLLVPVLVRVLRLDRFLVSKKVQEEYRRKKGAKQKI
jgi:predicted RND superfamily exporter protein